MAWTSATKPTRGNPTKKSEYDALVDRTEHISEDGSTFNQSGLGAAVATGALNGLLSSGMFSKLNGLRVVRSSYTGNGAGGGQEITVAAGETIDAIIILGDLSATPCMWVSLATGFTVLLSTSNAISAVASAGFNLNSSAGKFTADSANSGPNTNAKTYHYLAIIAP